DKYGVPANRYADFAILRGDPSDGLPGVKGVGEKTAMALIQAYGSLEGVVAEAAGEGPSKDGPLKGKPATKTRIRDSAASIEGMGRLVPIKSDAPVDRWTGERDDEVLEMVAADLGVSGPVKRLLAASV